MVPIPWPNDLRARVILRRLRYRQTLVRRHEVFRARTYEKPARRVRR